MGILTDIAGNTKSTETPVLVGAVDPTPLCLSNPQRYAVGFQAPSGVAIQITSAPNNSPQSGTLIGGGPITWFTVADHGSLAQAAWFAMPGGGAGPVTVWEITIPKE